MVSDAPSFDHKNVEPLVATLATLFADEGKAVEVAVLARCDATCQQTDYENIGHEIFSFNLCLSIPYDLYGQIEKTKDAIEQSILLKSAVLMAPYKHDEIRRVTITARLDAEAGWRDKAKAWLSGESVSNQGRIGEVAPCVHEGLLFRCVPSILLYEALKESGVTFAPLPALVVAGQASNALKPDFLLLKNGKAMLVVIDRGVPMQAQSAVACDGLPSRTIKATECNTADKARTSCQQLLAALDLQTASL